MTIPYIPTLSSAGGVITDKSSMAAYLLRQIFVQPSDGSRYFREHITSFREIYAQHGKNPQSFGALFEKKLTQILTRYIPDCDVSIQVEENNDPDSSEFNKYHLYISITAPDENGENKLVISSSVINITGSNNFTINFNKGGF